MTARRPIRALHVVDQLRVGGIETWLVQVLERTDRRRVAIDVLVLTEQRGAYEQRAEAAGARILRCPRPRSWFRFARRLQRLLQEHGPYDVMHSHVYHFSGLLLQQASRAGLPVRIAHSRNAEAGFPPLLGWAQRAFYRWMKRLLLSHMTHGLAVSESAGGALFGRAWRNDPRCRLLPSAIDLTPFREPVDSTELRHSIDLPGNAFVVGHIGRFVKQKNHAFLLDVFHAIRNESPRAYLVLVGEGPLREQVERSVDRMGLREYVRFLGRREDVPGLMGGLFDVVLLPSLWEGLPRTANEAQAAGLPIVLSSHLSPDIEVVEALVHRVSLEAGPAPWAAAALQAMCHPRPVSRDEAWRQMAASPINMDRNVEALIDLYESAVPSDA